LAVRSSALRVLTTMIRQTILHSNTDITAAVVTDVMDMDKAECSINSNPSVSPTPVPGE
jgi:hypothetical protein